MPIRKRMLRRIAIGFPCLGVLKPLAGAHGVGTRQVVLEATLIKYRHRHDAWKARRLYCMAPGRLAVLPSRAVQPAGLPGITPSLEFNMLGPPLSARISSVRRLDSQPGCPRRRPCELRADRGGDDGDT
jgi:hypothetical protein